MKRYALLILILFLMASLLPLAEPSEVLEDANTQNQTSGFYLAEIADSTPSILKSGQSFSCSLSNNNVKCWGDGNAGQLGIGTVTSQNTPRTVSFGIGKLATDISLGEAHACALLNDGSVSCWGTGQFGRLGIGTSDNIQTPSQTSP